MPWIYQVFSEKEKYPYEHTKPDERPLSGPMDRKGQTKKSASSLACRSRDRVERVREVHAEDSSGKRALRKRRRSPKAGRARPQSITLRLRLRYKKYKARIWWGMLGGAFIVRTLVAMGVGSCVARQPDYDVGAS